MNTDREDLLADVVRSMVAPRLSRWQFDYEPEPEGDE